MKPGIPDISVVIPLYNEEPNLGHLYENLAEVLNNLGKSHEIIFVDDGSRDRSFEMVKQLFAKDSNVKGISFSRNFGHQAALLAGLECSRGEIVIMMDADLQHPPDVIPVLIEKYKEGCDIVNTRRIDSGGTGFLKKITSALFYTLINFLSDVRIEPASADFRLMSRQAVDSFVKIKERARFTRGLVSWMGFKQAIVEYNEAPRFAGKSQYTLKKMLNLCFDGIISFSSKPLRLAFYLGLFVFLFGICYAVYAIIVKALGHAVPGWTSLLVMILIIGGVQLFCTGIIGEYIAKIYYESKSRPMYFIKEEVGVKL
ncbi:MAG: glycosyltransferase family 2 protein [Bacteroidia bacterium]|nr:glycosyltransferase family 2 protein [Bacteroidia bacterium]